MMNSSKYKALLNVALAAWKPWRHASIYSRGMSVKENLLAGTTALRLNPMLA
jgi:hypothetical protein